MTDADGQAIDPETNRAAASLVQGISVTLKRSSRPQSTTTTDAHGRFEFKDLTNVVPGNYTFEFAQPAGRKLSASDGNDAELFSGGQNGATGIFKLNTPTPGVDLADINVYYKTKPATESILLGYTLANNVAVNPVSAQVSSAVSMSQVVSLNWELLDSADTIIASADMPGATALITFPTRLADGEYRGIVTATDLFGHLSEKTSTPFTIDRTGPKLTAAVTSATQTGGAGTAPTDPASWIALYGVTATDGDGVGVSPAGIGVDASSVQTVPGTYSVNFRAADAIGNTSALLVLTYTVPSPKAPSLLLGKATATHEMGHVLPDDAAWIDLFRVSASAELPATSITSITVDASAVDANRAGDYPVAFFATDNLGTISKLKSGTVSVKDTYAPILVLGTPEITFQRGDSKISPSDHASWIELFGAYAADSGAGMPTTGTLGITVNASAVNYAVSGSYPVIFTATDKSGLSTSLTGKYVVEYADAPKASFATPTVSYEMGSAPLAKTDAEWKALFGATATSTPGTSVKSFIVDASSVDYATAGSYHVWFTVTDSADTETRAFTTVVVQDSTAPELTVESNKHTYGRGDAKISGADGWIALFQPKGHDSGSGMPTTRPYGITVDASAVNYNQADTYDIIFTATDASGNVSELVTVAYEVVFVDSGVETPGTKPDTDGETNTPGPASPNTTQAATGLAATGGNGLGIALIGAALLIAAAAVSLVSANRRRTAANSQ